MSTYKAFNAKQSKNLFRHGNSCYDVNMWKEKEWKNVNVLSKSDKEKKYCTSHTINFVEDFFSQHSTLSSAFWVKFIFFFRKNCFVRKFFISMQRLVKFCWSSCNWEKFSCRKSLKGKFKFSSRSQTFSVTLIVTFLTS